MNSIAPEIGESTVALGAQLGASAALVLGMVVIHSLGLLAISKLLHLREDELKRQNFNARSVGLLGTMGLLIFLLHVVEIVIFAAFFMGVGALSTLEEALYYSASAYATLGQTADDFPIDWRLIGALEALIGFILIGWSTAFMVKTMNRLES